MVLLVGIEQHLHQTPRRIVSRRRPASWRATTPRRSTLAVHRHHLVPPRRRTRSPYTPPTRVSPSVPSFGACPAANAAQFQTVTITVTAPNGDHRDAQDRGAAAMSARGRTSERARAPEARVDRRSCSRCCSSRCAAVMIGGLMTFTEHQLGRDDSRSARAASDDYDAEAAMQAAIATVRIGDGCSRAERAYTPSWTLNNPARPLRVDCFALSSSTGSSAKRNDVLSVCPSSVAAPCPDTQSLLRAERHLLRHAVRHRDERRHPDVEQPVSRRAWRTATTPGSRSSSSWSRS